MFFFLQLSKLRMTMRSLTAQRGFILNTQTRTSAILQIFRQQPIKNKTHTDAHTCELKVDGDERLFKTPRDTDIYITHTSRMSKQFKATVHVCARCLWRILVNIWQLRVRPVPVSAGEDPVLRAGVRIGAQLEPPDSQHKQTSSKTHDMEWKNGLYNCLSINGCEFMPSHPSVKLHNQVNFLYAIYQDISLSEPLVHNSLEDPEPP